MGQNNQRGNKLRRTIIYTYKDKVDEFDHVINIKQTFEYKLGARVDLKIEIKYVYQLLILNT